MKCNILHRDISNGNILILPVLVQDPKTGKWQVEWMGFLVDWEMAKSAAEAERGQEARQPERTVSTSLFHSKDHDLISDCRGLGFICRWRLC